MRAVVILENTKRETESYIKRIYSEKKAFECIEMTQNGSIFKSSPKVIASTTQQAAKNNHASLPRSTGGRDDSSPTVCVSELSGE